MSNWKASGNIKILEEIIIIINTWNSGDSMIYSGDISAQIPANPYISNLKL